MELVSSADYAGSAREKKPARHNYPASFFALMRPIAVDFEDGGGVYTETASRQEQFVQQPQFAVAPGPQAKARD